MPRNNATYTPHNRTSVVLVIGFGLLACLLYGLGAGIRSDIGILLQPLAIQCGCAYADVSLCIAVMQLVFGGTQPFFGVLASRKSNRFILLLGVGLIILSLIGMHFAHSFWTLMLALGVMFGCGTGAIAFGLVLSSAIRFVGPERAMMIAGLLNAASGMVGFALSPAMQSLLEIGGLDLTLPVLGVLAAVLVPIIFVVTSRDHVLEDEPEPDDSSTDGGAHRNRPALPFREAFHNRTFLLLIAGFSTCGFHMVIIETHLFNQYVLDGIDATAAAWAFSVYGIATIVGALLSGWLSTRVGKGRLLGFYYGFRAVWTLAYLFIMPKTLPFAVLFAIGLGLTGDATVSPTSGLVSREFHVAHVATLVGVLFFCHQIGAFLSAWLGGVIVDATGGYTLLWAIDICLCLSACAASLRIRD